MPQVPGWLACMLSIRATRNTFGIAIFTLMQRHTDLICKSHQYKGIYEFVSFNRSSILLWTQSCTSFNTASFLEREAIEFFNENFPHYFTEQWTLGLFVRGMLMSGEAPSKSGIGIDCGFLLLIGSSSLTRVDVFVVLYKRHGNLINEVCLRIIRKQLIATNELRKKHWLYTCCLTLNSMSGMSINLLENVLNYFIFSLSGCANILIVVDIADFSWISPRGSSVISYL